MISYHDRQLELTADEILGIDANRPESIFTADADAVTSQFRKLVQKWHPDHNHEPKAGEVFDHLLRLRDSAQEKLTKHAWQEPGFFTCRLTNGKTLRIRSDASHDFELGTMHIGPTAVNYVVKREYADLFKNAVDTIGKLGFADDKMKKTYKTCLPVAFKTYEGEEFLILTIRKSPDHILLRDLMPTMPKDNLDRHVAWEMSRLHELSRYLDYAGIVHHDITPDTVFVSPSDHTIGLLGGWWYATKIGEPLQAVPAASEEFISAAALACQRPDPKTDLEMIRACGRELLGDRGGTRLTALKSAPQPMIDYLREPTSGSAQRDLKHWYQKVLPASFGARRFTKLPVTYSDIYKPKGV